MYWKSYKRKPKAHSVTINGYKQCDKTLKPHIKTGAMGTVSQNPKTSVIK